MTTRLLHNFFSGSSEQSSKKVAKFSCIWALHGWNKGQPPYNLVHIYTSISNIYAKNMRPNDWELQATGANGQRNHQWTKDHSYCVVLLLKPPLGQPCQPPQWQKPQSPTYQKFWVRTANSPLKRKNVIARTIYAWFVVLRTTSPTNAPLVGKLMLQI